MTDVAEVSHKPLGIKAYGSIGHLPCSRMGPGDHAVPDGQATIATMKARDKHDTIFVEEKLDGSCVAVAKVGGRVVPLGRAGYEARSSKYEQHRMFADWVFEDYGRWDSLLNDGERIVGEWLAQAHGTRYNLLHEPFVVFDLMRGKERAAREEFNTRCATLVRPAVLGSHDPMSVESAMKALSRGGFHGAIDPVEGAVWRVERNGKFDFLCKFVRPEKVDGSYLPEVSGGAAVWNWTRQ